MTEPQNEVIGQIYVYPYEYDITGKGFGERHLGLSKLVLTKRPRQAANIDRPGSSTSDTDRPQSASSKSSDVTSTNTNNNIIYDYFLTAIRQSDNERLLDLKLLHSIKVKYAEQDHFLLFINQSTKVYNGYGTCHDEPSIVAVKQFVQQIQDIISNLPQAAIASNQARQLAASKHATLRLNAQNIDFLTAASGSSSSSISLLNNNNTLGNNNILGSNINAKSGTTHNNGQSNNNTTVNPNNLITINENDDIPTMLAGQHQPPDDSVIAIPAPHLIYDTTPVTQNQGLPRNATLKRIPPQDNDSKENDGATATSATTSAPAVPEATSQTPPTDEPVSLPFNVTHVSSIKFDKDTGFKGIPPEWEGIVNKQFGITIQNLQGKQLPGYKHRIPYVLLTLTDLLIDQGGMITSGIFRVAPQGEHTDEAKRRINEGFLLGKHAKRNADNNKLIFNYDVHVFSALIKGWFRDLPEPIAPHKLTQLLLTSSLSPTDAENLVNEIPEPAQSAFLFLIDFLAVVSLYSSINRMNPKNLSIVFAPNLYRTQGFQNDQALSLAQKAAAWVEVLIVSRVKNPNPHLIWRLPSKKDLSDAAAEAKEKEDKAAKDEEAAATKKENEKSTNKETLSA